MSEFAARRTQLLGAIGDGVALFPSAPLAVRNRDVDHPYRQIATSTI
jgi:Xaa-Pro aminopeptidase